VLEPRRDARGAPHGAVAHLGSTEWETKELSPTFERQFGVQKPTSDSEPDVVAQRRANATSEFLGIGVMSDPHAGTGFGYVRLRIAGAVLPTRLSRACDSAKPGRQFD